MYSKLYSDLGESFKHHQCSFSFDNQGRATKCKGMIQVPDDLVSWVQEMKENHIMQTFNTLQHETHN